MGILAEGLGVMRNNWKLRCIILAAAVILLTAISIQGGTFLDLEGEDAEKAELISDLGFLYYDLVPYFSPEKLITRKEAAEIMYILDKGYFYNDGATGFVSSYIDVYKADYVINYCRENGLIRGYGDNSFKPNNPITCAEIIEMFVKTLGFENTRVLTFPDEYLTVAADIGLLNDIDFEPDDYTTNLTAAKLVFNALTLPLYPVKGKQNLLETRFSDLYKIVLETEDRIERMLNLLEDVDGMDIQLINADFAMISECYKQLSAININCEFKFSLEMQYMRKMNDYMNTIAELRDTFDEVKNIDVYTDFDNYKVLLIELKTYADLLDAEPYSDKRRADIYLNAVYTMLDLCGKIVVEVDSKLPDMNYLAQDFADLEMSVIEALESEDMESQSPIDFYDGDNWIIQIINRYNQTELLYNFLTERGLADDNSYYDKLLEITYIIRSMYYIKGFEYSVASESEPEYGMTDEYYAISREIRSELSRLEFKYYSDQLIKITQRFDDLFMEYSQVSIPQIDEYEQ